MDSDSFTEPFQDAVTGIRLLLRLKPEVDTQIAYKLFAHVDPSIRQAWESHQRNQTVSGMAAKEPLVEFNPINLFVQDLEVGHRQSPRSLARC